MSRGLSVVLLCMSMVHYNRYRLLLILVRRRCFLHCLHQWGQMFLRCQRRNAIIELIFLYNYYRLPTCELYIIHDTIITNTIIILHCLLTSSSLKVACPLSVGWMRGRSFQISRKSCTLIGQEAIPFRPAYHTTRSDHAYTRYFNNNNVIIEVQ